MDTPIVDFVSRYRSSGTLRLHMPGHKGVRLLGMEDLDITEVHGADSLYQAAGIIARSEENASRLFGCPTYYSTEGSSQCIRAMLLLARQCSGGKRLRLLAVRNAHRTLLSACALLDVEVEWLSPGGYLSCALTADDAERAVEAFRPHALYLTSPDYLGGMSDIAALAEVCCRHGVLLLVDNAHGAYLKFLQPSLHPMDLGADLCCDSAHKTLPALTGGAYLHVSAALAEKLGGGVKNAMAMFGSTSPSYLILQSLDAVNRCLAEGYREALGSFAELVSEVKMRLADRGYVLFGQEPMKITLMPKSRGYTGEELAELLRGRGVECEFADPDHIVFMLTPEIGESGLRRLTEALLDIPAGRAVTKQPPGVSLCPQVMTVREASFAPSEIVAAEESAGRILASPSVGCPPAVPIVMCGERIDTAAVEAFRYYGVTDCAVVVE